MGIVVFNGIIVLKWCIYAVFGGVMVCHMIEYCYVYYTGFFGVLLCVLL